MYRYKKVNRNEQYKIEIVIITDNLKKKSYYGTNGLTPPYILYFLLF